METNYRKAWVAFTETGDYKTACDFMLTKGLKQPYIDNILQSVFSAGRGDKKIVPVKE